MKIQQHGTHLGEIRQNQGHEDQKFIKFGSNSTKIQQNGTHLDEIQQNQGPEGQTPAATPAQQRTPSCPARSYLIKYRLGGALPQVMLLFSRFQIGLG